MDIIIYVIYNVYSNVHSALLLESVCSSLL